MIARLAVGCAESIRFYNIISCKTDNEVLGISFFKAAVVIFAVSPCLLTVFKANAPWFTKNGADIFFGGYPNLDIFDLISRKVIANIYTCATIRENKGHTDYEKEKDMCNASPLPAGKIMCG